MNLTGILKPSPSTAPSPSARCRAPLLGWLWWTSWTWTTTTRSTPREPICFGGWAGTARPRPPTSVRPPWRRQTPSWTSSGSVAEVRAERTGDYEQVAGAGFHLVAEALDGAADGGDARDGAVVPQDRGGDGPGKCKECDEGGPPRLAGSGSSAGSYREEARIQCCTPVWISAADASTSICSTLRARRSRSVRRRRMPTACAD